MDLEAEFLQAVNVADQTRILAFIEQYDPVPVCNAKRYTALHIATQNNSVYLIQLMVQRQEELRAGTIRKWVNAKTDEGWTCLHIAAKQGKLALAEMLVGLGAEVDAANEEGACGLHIAAQNNHPALIAYFHEEFNLQAIIPDYQGNTPLHYAAHEGSDQALSLLLIYAREHIDVKNGRDNRPLHVAAAAGHLRTTRLLMSQGADLHALVRVT